MLLISDRVPAPHTGEREMSYKINTYRLSDKGRALTYKNWKKIKGNELSHYSETMVSRKLNKPVGYWDELTLGRIVDCFIVADREFARFAIEFLKKEYLVYLER